MAGEKLTHGFGWKLRVAPTCWKDSGAQKCLWRQLATGEAPLSSPNYSVKVGGGGCLWA
ncbi:hypothetical protein L195_g020320 [Trifolium pratense]|uniref:Uncharacterized protein n=1 Tax=Trifolium pratense TaxID=57577 RepID=A0A2K3N218_TRIPR|nr:hypothetical protein L195_g020320 [Trifolium pratense]